jgi:radical SAM protein with 4Fe4S-binding SPASM domain
MTQAINPQQLKKRIMLRLQGKKPKGGWLQSTQIELAGRCTADCEFCNWTKRPKEQQVLMPTDLALKAVKESRELYADQISFHITGESLLHPDILKIIPKDYPTLISTNCMLLEGEIAMEFAKMPNLLVIMAVLWSEPKVRREKSIANAKAYLNLNPINRNIFLQMICSRHAVYYADEMYDMFSPYLDKLPKLQLHYKQPYTRDPGNPIVGQIPCGIKLRDDNRIQVDKMPTPQSAGCNDCMVMAPNPVTDILVQADGQIKPCYYVWDGWNLGNIRDTTLSEAWNSGRMQQLRHYWRTGDPDNKTACYECIRMAKPAGRAWWEDLNCPTPTSLDNEQQDRGMIGKHPIIRKALRKVINKFEV